MAETAGGGATGRSCGACSLCCTLLRVDELAKLGGTPCLHQRAGGGCAIHPRRPAICRRYRCLWLAGSLEEGDRPDRLGAVLDLASRGGLPELVVHEREAGALDASPRLRAIAERWRASMPVRVLDAGDPLDPERPFRLLLPGGDEQRVAGDRVEIWRDGELVRTLRAGWIERALRRAALCVRWLRLTPHRRGPRSAGAPRRGE